MPKCKICNDPFVKTRPIQPTCLSSTCMFAYAIAYANNDVQKAVK